MRDLEVLQLSSENVSEIVNWCNGLEVEEVDPTNPSNKYVGVNVPTFTGRVRASEGDYVIWDPILGFTVRKPGLFEMMFERVS